MPAGRPRKPTEQLKLSGTYRKDRHGNNADTIISDTLDVPKKLIPPETITDLYCQQHYEYHTNLLIKLKILTASDLPELELMYCTLQRCREIQKTLSTLDMATQLEDYAKLVKILRKESDYFSKIAQKYYISPTARARIKMEQLNLEKAQEESAMAKRLKAKKA
jgi:hypothetical protein